MFNTQYQEFIYKRTYSRWMEDEGRREEYFESVNRFGDYFFPRVPDHLKEDYWDVIDAMQELKVMPSMRALWTAGKALDVDNIAGYNCAYTVVGLDSPKDFADILYILMNGVGMGFSTERQFINELPEVPDEIKPTEKVIVVQDSKQGWAEAFEELLSYLYLGFEPEVDYSLVRPKGARLKTFGGRASGHEPLKDLFEFTVNTFKDALGRKLNSLEAYDIVCKTAEIVIVGGVRRSATMNISNLSDQRMAKAKQGEFWIHTPYRSLSNNSVAYTEKPEIGRFMEEWLNLMQSGTGERGIVNRKGLIEHSKERSRGREVDETTGLNPCGETILENKGLCNLTEVVIRPDDSLRDLVDKVSKATFLGMLQSTLTDFNFVDEKWSENQKENRLLGVSLTGMKDHPVIGATNSRAKEWLHTLKCTAVMKAEQLAKQMGINVPKAVTVVKPSGTVSQLVDSSSGIHARHSQYYIRRVRVASYDPICKLLRSMDIPHHPEVGQDESTANTYVFEFPMKAPDTSVIRGDETAIEQLEYWKQVKEYWTEHNPSQTIYVKETEWLEVGAWVYENFDLIGGLSFLPYDGGVYKLAPYEEIDEETYTKLAEELPDIEWEYLTKFEQEDRTQGSREYACSGGGCSIV